MSYLELYYKNKLPNPLTEDRLNDYLNKYYISHDQEIRNLLIMTNLYLVISQLKKYQCETTMDREDLMEEGIFGLIKAINSFSPLKKVKFTTFASVCIRNQILYYLRSNSKHTNLFSIEQENTEDNEKAKERINLKSSHQVEEEYIRQELVNKIHQIVINLPPKEEKLIRMNYGFQEGIIYSQKEIAEEFQVTPSRISKLNHRILAKIEQELIETYWLEHQSKPKRKKLTKNSEVFI